MLALRSLQARYPSPKRSGGRVWREGSEMGAPQGKAVNPGKTTAKAGEGQEERVWEGKRKEKEPNPPPCVLALSLSLSISCKSAASAVRPLQ